MALFFMIWEKKKKNMSERDVKCEMFLNKNRIKINKLKKQKEAAPKITMHVF